LDQVQERGSERVRKSRKYAVEQSPSTVGEELVVGGVPSPHGPHSQLSILSQGFDQLVQLIRHRFIAILNVMPFGSVDPTFEVFPDSGRIITGDGLKYPFLMGIYSPAKKEAGENHLGLLLR
jgi:hypothetical protein